MKLTLFHEAAKVWQQLSSGASSRRAHVELEIQNRLLTIFQVGDFYYYILNLEEMKLDMVSKEIKSVLGYNPEDLDIASFVGKIHPEDHPWFLTFENKVLEFFSNLTFEQIPDYKVRYDYRIRKSDGSYIRILQQVITIDYDENGRVLRTLGVHTDISHLKTEGKPILSFIGLNGQPSYINVATENIFKPNSLLTRREREILTLLAEGKKSKEIAAELSISKETVSTHRKKLLAKLGALNTIELIKKATREGWL